MKNAEKATAFELESEIYPMVIIELANTATKLYKILNKLKNEDAIEHCTYGLQRRIFTLRNCLIRISEISPPTRSQILSESEKSDLTAHLHCFYVNNSGVYNNLAFIWYFEKLTEQDRGKIEIRDLNIFKKEFRKFLPNKLVRKCEEFSGWHKNLNDFRDPLAHRIPFYVVPYSIPKNNIDTYNELDRKWLSEPSSFKRDAILNEMESLGTYTAIISGSFKDKRIITLHQVIPDAKTLIAVVDTFLEVF